MRGRQILGLENFQGRNPNGYFRDPPWPVRQRAYNWLHRFWERARRERGKVSGWLFAI